MSRRGVEGYKGRFYLLAFSMSSVGRLSLDVRSVPRNLLRSFLLTDTCLLKFGGRPLRNGACVSNNTIGGIPATSLLGEKCGSLVRMEVFNPKEIPGAAVPRSNSLLRVRPEMKLNDVLRFSTGQDERGLGVNCCSTGETLCKLAKSVCCVRRAQRRYCCMRVVGLLDRLRGARCHFGLGLPVNYSSERLFCKVLRTDTGLVEVPGCGVCATSRL